MTTTVETNILLRALAITLIVGTHVGLFQVLGGAHLLLIVAGWSFARFCLAPTDTGTSSGILRSAARIAIPSILWLVWRVADTTDVGLSNVLLIDNYVRSGARGYWFVEVLVHTLVVFALVFAIPAVRRLERRHGFAFALVTLCVALLLNVTTEDTAAFPERSMTTHAVLWLFALGWLAHRAATVQQKAVAIAVALLTVPGYFHDPDREAIITVGFALLMLVPRLALPRPVVRLAGPVAAASLYTYLTHYAVFYLTSPHLPAPVVLTLCLGVGVVIAEAVRRARLIARQPRPVRNPSRQLL